MSLFQAFLSPCYPKAFWFHLLNVSLFTSSFNSLCCCPDISTYCCWWPRCFINHLIVELSHLNLPTVRKSGDNIIPILQTKGKAGHFSDLSKVTQPGGLGIWDLNADSLTPEMKPWATSPSPTPAACKNSIIVVPAHFILSLLVLLYISAIGCL